MLDVPPMKLTFVLAIPATVATLLAACSDDAGTLTGLDGGPSSSSSGAPTSSGSSGASSSSSSGSGSSSGANGTSSSSGSVGTSSSSGGANTTTDCVGFKATGNEVHPTVGSGTAPAPAGGTLVDGTYQLTAATAYGSGVSPLLGAATVKSTLVITAGKFVRGYDFSAGPQSSVGADSGSYALDQATDTITAGNVTCTDGGDDSGFGSLSGGYTATATSLTLIQDSPALVGGDKITYTLTKQ